LKSKRNPLVSEDLFEGIRSNKSELGKKNPKNYRCILSGVSINWLITSKWKIPIPPWTKV